MTPNHPNSNANPNPNPNQVLNHAMTHSTASALPSVVCGALSCCASSLLTYGYSLCYIRLQASFVARSSSAGYH